MVSPVFIYGCESWTVKKAECRRIGAFFWIEFELNWTVVLQKTLESPLDCTEIQPVHSKGDQPWVFFGRNDAEAETPVLRPPYVKSWLIGKDSDAGRDWGQEEKGMTEDERAGWHHRLDGHESEWTPGDGDGQGGLACCDSWVRKESDMTEQLNWLRTCPLSITTGKCPIQAGIRVGAGTLKQVSSQGILMNKTNSRILEKYQSLPTTFTIIFIVVQIWLLFSC